MTNDQIKTAHAAIIERETNIIRMINHWENNKNAQQAAIAHHRLAPCAPSAWPTITLEHIEPSGGVYHLPRTRRRG